MPKEPQPLKEAEVSTAPGLSVDHNKSLKARGLIGKLCNKNLKFQNILLLNGTKTRSINSQH